MAIPTITNNSPSAGRITWGAFNIQLNGVAYSVGSGSTADRWVWWKYNGGAPTLMSGADVPTTLTDDDLVLFANKNGIGVRVQSTNFIDGELLVDGSIFAEALSTNLINSQHIVTAGLDAGVIKFGTMSGERISADTITATQIAASAIGVSELAANSVTANAVAANAITADKIGANQVTADKIGANQITGDKIAANSIGVTRLIVSDFTNLIVDGDLADPTSNTWFQVGPNDIVRVKPAANTEPAYLANRNKAFSETIYFRNENKFEVNVGSEFEVSFEVSTPAANTETLRFVPALHVWDQNGASMLWRYFDGDTSFPIEPGTDWTRITGTIKLNDARIAKAVWNPYADQIVGANNTQEIRLRMMSIRRKSAGGLIVDGTLEGKHIRSNSITSEQIDAKTITGDLFASKVVHSGLVQAGELDDAGEFVGGYSEMGSLGIFTIDDAKEPVASFPTSSSEGAYLKAHLDLLSADVRDDFTMHGTNNSIAVGSELMLSNGVEAPGAPPVLTQTWDQLQFEKTRAVPPHTPSTGYNLGTFAFNPAQATAMAWDSTWSNWLVIQQKSNGFRVWRFGSDGKIANNLGTGRPWVDDFNDRTLASVAFNDDVGQPAYLFKSGGSWYFWGHSNINRVGTSWILGPAGQAPTITYDTTANQYCLVQNYGSVIHVRRFSQTAGANFPYVTYHSAVQFEADSSVAPRLNGAVFGSQLGVANSWAINSDTYQTVYTFNSAGVQYNDEGTYRNWLKPGSAVAFAHNGTQFASLDASGILTFYENWTWLGLDRYVWIGASAFDSTSGSGDTANPHVGQLAGQHETPVGTMKSVALYRRNKLRITMPETNDSGQADDPDKWRIYFKRGGSTAPTDKSLLKLVDTIGSPTAPTSVTITADATGATPPGGIRGQIDAYNNFPGADPGRFESAASDLLGPKISLAGDGSYRLGNVMGNADTSGRAGPLSWNASGVGGLDHYSPRRMLSTSTGVTLVIGESAANGSITWPAGYFSGTPVVFVQSINTSVWNAYVNSVSSTSASLGVRHFNNTASGSAATITVRVLAIQN